MNRAEIGHYYHGTRISTILSRHKKIIARNAENEEKISRLQIDLKRQKFI